MNGPATFDGARASLAPGRPGVVRIDAAASWHPDGISAGPASVLVDNLSERQQLILAHDTPELVDHHPAAAAAQRIELPHHVLLPGLVNAHTHLDLTHIGPHPWEQGAFTDWLAIIRAGRLSDQEAIAASVRMGAQLSIAGGTVIVGDIGGAVRAEPSLAAPHALADSGLHGVAFIEFFAIGTRAVESLGLVERCMATTNQTLRDTVRIGFSPHATNTVEPMAYERTISMASVRGFPLCTHLAESRDEREFIGHATGPQRRLLEAVGAWQETLLSSFGLGKHPVDHMASSLQRAADCGVPFLVAHVNDATDGAIQTLARTRTSVVYCPRGSAYFGAERHFGPHRYQDMLDAGVNVCLGTDSVVNITDGTVTCSAPRSEGACDQTAPNVLPGKISGRLSVLDEMRFLFKRDATDALTLIRMATTHGAAALGVEPELVRLVPGARPLAVLAIPIEPGPQGSAAVGRALESTSAPISILTRIFPAWQQ